MAPPRRISRQQLEILMDYLEQNRDMSKGLLPGTPVSHQKTRQKWTLLARQLNAVQCGAKKTPDGWKKYWFEWRHKCRKKAANLQRHPSRSDSANRYVSLNDLEVRVLELSGKGSVAAVASNSSQLENFLAEDSDSEPLESIKVRSTPAKIKVRHSNSSPPRSPIEATTRNITPPPKWVIDLEERRTAAEERMAEALESMAKMMRTQEERRGILEERIADALTAISGTVQDLNSGIQDALLHFQQIHPLQPNGEGSKGDVLL